MNPGWGRVGGRVASSSGLAPSRTWEGGAPLEGLRKSPDSRCGSDTLAGCRGFTLPLDSASSPDMGQCNKHTTGLLQGPATVKGHVVFSITIYYSFPPLLEGTPKFWVQGLDESGWWMNQGRKP